MDLNNCNDDSISIDDNEYDSGDSFSSDASMNHDEILYDQENNNKNFNNGIESNQVSVHLGTKKHFPIMLLRYIRRANNIKEKKKRTHLSHEIINDHMDMYILKTDQNEKIIELLCEWLKKHWDCDVNYSPVKRRLRSLSNILVCTDIVDGINETELIKNIIVIFSDDAHMINKLIHLFPDYTDLFEKIIYEQKSLYEKIKNSWLIDNVINLNYINQIKNVTNLKNSKTKKCVLM